MLLSSKYNDNNLYMSISKAEVIKNCKTGDLLLFNTRTHWYDFLIERFTKSKFSHVGMIVRDISCAGCEDVGVCMLEAGYESFPDVVENKKIYGVQLSNLEKVLNTYDDTGRDGYVYYRSLEYDRDQAFNEQTRKSIEPVYGKPYDLLPQDWLKSAFNIEKGNETRTNTFWCSALVAYMYDKYGFIDRQTPWTIIQPTQFSYYEGKQIELNSKINLLPEVCIQQ